MASQFLLFIIAAASIEARASPRALGGGTKGTVSCCLLLLLHIDDME